VRVALGAGSRGVLASVLARPLGQVGSGVLVGTALAALAASGHYHGLTARMVLALVAYGALMLVVCMLGSAAPARWALRIDPMQALKAE
jgi:hypothetical protein